MPASVTVETVFSSIDSALDAAREKAERANQGVVVTHVDHPPLNPCRFWRCGFVRVEPFDALPYEYLGELLEDDSAGVAPWYAYPSGLALPAMCVNWFWWVPERVETLRLGTAEQVVRFCQRQGIDERGVECVHADDVHGTCVFSCTHRDWRMYQARAFPAWATPRR